MPTVTLHDYLMTLDKDEIIEWIIDNYLDEAKDYYKHDLAEYQMLINGKERLAQDGFYDAGDLVYYRGFSDILDREFGITVYTIKDEIDADGPAAYIHGYANGHEWRWHYDGYEVKADDSQLIRAWRFTEEAHDENDFWIIEASHPVFGKHYRIATNDEHAHFYGADR